MWVIDLSVDQAHGEKKKFANSWRLVHRSIDFASLKEYI